MGPGITDVRTRLGQTVESATPPGPPQPVIHPGSVLEPFQRATAAHPNIGPFAVAYVAPPTDAMEAGPGAFQLQPVSPGMFSSLEESQIVLERLKAGVVVPDDARLVDESFRWYPFLIFGRDGRRVWCVEFTVPGTQTTAAVNISTPVGRLLFYQFTYPNKRLIIEGTGITIKVSD